MLIPVGADIRYEDGVIRILAKAAGIRLQLLPKSAKRTEEAKLKPVKPEKEKAPRKKKEERKKHSLSLDAEEIIALLKTVFRGFGRFGKKFKVERFVLHWIAAGWDPYWTARIFGVVNAGLSQLAPVCTERFHCKDSSVWTDIDFTREESFFEFGITATIRIGQILGAALCIGFGALKIIMQNKRRTKKEAKIEADAMKKWLIEHPDDAIRYKAEMKADEETEKEYPSDSEINLSTDEMAKKEYKSA